MKKNILLVFVMLLSVSLLVGCMRKESIQEADSEAAGQLKIIATGFAPYDFAKQIVGEYGEVSMLLAPGAESHSYEPTPQDIISIQNSNIFIYGGGESDEWVTDVLASIGNGDIKVIKMLDCVELIEEETVEGMQEEEHEHEADQEEIEYDEHVWTSPKNAIQIVEAIKKEVIAEDPAHQSVYEANCQKYVEELTALDEAFLEVVNQGKRKEVIFADRFPLRYFVEAYGLKYYAAFPGCSTDTEPSASTVAFLIDKVKEDKIPVVFHIELSNEKMADTICEATGAKKLLFNACHNISKTDFERGVTYLEMMKKNVEVLKEALN